MKMCQILKLAQIQQKAHISYSILFSDYESEIRFEIVCFRNQKYEIMQSESEVSLQIFEFQSK